MEPRTALALGQKLLALRTQDINWTRIRTMTGIGDGLGSVLVEEWVEHLHDLYEADRLRIVDLPLPPSPVLTFPEAPGRRDAWVFHNGVYADAHYRGETEDGEWILVQLRAGRGNSMKWIRQINVRLYGVRPEPSIREFIGRSERERSTARRRAG